MALSVFEQLAERMPDSSVKFRKGSKNKEGDKNRVLAYVDARDVQNRLDTVLGAANWQDKYIRFDGGFICELSIRVDGEWITKSGVGEDKGDITEDNAQKSAESDALKRAAVKFGIARHLYTDAISPMWVAKSVPDWEVTATLRPANGSLQPSPKAASGNESPSDPAPKPSDRTKRIGMQGEQELLALFASAFEDETERIEHIELIKTRENVAYLRDIFEHRHFAIANRLIEITNENERKQLDTPQKLSIDRVNRLKLAIDAAFGQVNRQKKMRLFCQQYRVRSLSELSVDQYNKLLTILQQAEKKRGNGIIEDGETTPDDLVSDIIEDLAFVDTSSKQFKAFQATGAKKFGKRWNDVRKEIVIQVTHGEQTSAAKLRVIEMDDAFKALEAWEVEGVTA